MNRKTFLPFPEETLPETDNGPYQALLGFKDREMMMIQEVFDKCEIPYQYATFDGKPVTARNCYDADPVTVRNGHTLLLVECASREIRGFHGKPRVVDHHPENPLLPPGFNAPPELYWQACSLGQVWTLTKRKHRLKQPGKAHLIGASRDHSRFAAARGECPGVTPEEVALVGRRWIVQELNEKKDPGETRVSRAEFDERIRQMTRIIDRSPVITLGNQEVADLRRLPIENASSFDYFSIYEALADLSCAALIKTGNLTGDNNKLVLLGDLVPSTVKHFKEVWAEQEGLIEVYGCENRGYAGGYYAPPLRIKKAA